MLARTKRIAAATILLFLGVALLYVDAGRASGRRSPSVGARASHKSHAPISPQRAFKKELNVDAESGFAESARTPWRNLFPRERREEMFFGDFRLMALPRLILAPKVSTNLFLSVLNL